MPDESNEDDDLSSVGLTLAVVIITFLAVAAPLSAFQPRTARQFTCNEVGSHKLTLKAIRPFQPGDGALYVDTQGFDILVKTVPQDYDGDTTLNEVADTLVIDCVEPFDFNGTPVIVGGLQTALEAPESSGSNAGLLAGIVAAIAAGTVTLGGAAWYARRRWAR